MTRGKGLVTVASQPDSDIICCGTLTKPLPNHSGTFLYTAKQGYFLESPAHSPEAWGEPGKSKLNSSEDRKVASLSQPQASRGFDAAAPLWSFQVRFIRQRVCLLLKVWEQETEISSWTETRWKRLETQLSGRTYTEHVLDKTKREHDKYNLSEGLNKEYFI